MGITQNQLKLLVYSILDALSDSNQAARAGILVPEGVLFDGNKVYTSLRTQLVEKHSLESVISLPSGLFGKNIGVKSNILIVKKILINKKSIFGILMYRTMVFLLMLKDKKFKVKMILILF